jgi:hypothetical protein
MGLSALTGTAYTLTVYAPVAITMLCSPSARVGYHPIVSPLGRARPSQPFSSGDALSPRLRSSGLFCTPTRAESHSAENSALIVCASIWRWPPTPPNGCLLWVISGHGSGDQRCRLHPQRADRHCQSSRWLRGLAATYTEHGSIASECPENRSKSRARNRLDLQLQELLATIVLT